MTISGEHGRGTKADYAAAADNYPAHLGDCGSWMKDALTRFRRSKSLGKAISPTIQ
jgi:hypothetical protein